MMMMMMMMMIIIIIIPKCLSIASLFILTSKRWDLIVFVSHYFST